LIFSRQVFYLTVFLCGKNLFDSFFSFAIILKKMKTTVKNQQILATPIISGIIILITLPQVVS